MGEVEAMKIVYTANMIDAFGRPIEVSNTQYFVLDGSIAYIVTLSLPAEMVEEYLQPFSEVVQTFRLLE